jgi:RsiW-degrading membrane proteinase PrsW (M82 family)
METLQKLQQRERLLSRLTVLIPMVLAAVLVWMAPAYAISDTTKRVLNKFAALCWSVALPIAALGIASFGLSFFQGEKKAEEGKARAKLCLIAVACLALLFTVIHAGMAFASGTSSTGKSRTWDPTLPSTQEQIIEPATKDMFD